MTDGLTVPFALAAGLSEAVSGTSVIVTAGLAEIAAGAIAMGLGGYLAARTDAHRTFKNELGHCVLNIGTCAYRRPIDDAVRPGLVGR
jgi:hypothetical protein